MFIRLYLNAKNKDQAQHSINKFLKIFEPITESEQLLKVEPYWKIENIYVAEIDIIPQENYTSKSLNEILYEISDHWIEFGDPVNELLASATDDNCKFIIPEFNMVNIHFH
ncbi:hypothetical protein [Bacillus sp. FJAT-52991]|uniref:Uncharacterized protein n=1 Tax=Bacillus kandeliae TaxID=3129297 RepID=A0ABZ2N4J4_9BACI